MSNPPFSLTAAEATAQGIGAEALVRSCLDRIAGRDPVIRAWTFLDPALALDNARDLDRLERKSPLHGIPIGVKDVIDTADMPTQQNSPLYRGHRPSLDAACVMTLRAAGALIFGKTDTVEFAAAGRKALTRNPFDLSRTPGGSSSGSAAAVADYQVPIALGTQTGGSTIRPASFCGVFAMKPTWGIVAREGLKIYSVTLDTLGWYARSVADLALLADVFAIADDSPPAPFVLKGARIAVCTTPAWPLADPATRDALAKGASLLGQAGAEVTTLDLPAAFDPLILQQDIIMKAEGRAAFLSEARRNPGLLNAEFHDRVNNADGFTNAQLRTAYDNAGACRAAFDDLAGSFDAVLTPSAVGEATVGLESTGDAAFNRMWTLLHTPCINVPGFKGPNGLPVGLTLTGPRFSDRKLLVVAEEVAKVFAAGGGWTLPRP